MPARTKKTALRRAFGDAIRERRIAAGMSQEQLSFDAKVHRTYVGDLERGLKSPTLDVIDQLARALDMSPTELIAGVYHASGTTTVAPAQRRQRVRKGKTL
jgi:transcriptional regulator with XRE-family HTH domain